MSSRFLPISLQSTKSASFDEGSIGGGRKEKKRQHARPQTGRLSFWLKALKIPKFFPQISPWKRKKPKKKKKIEARTRIEKTKKKTGGEKGRASHEQGKCALRPQREEFKKTCSPI